MKNVRIIFRPSPIVYFTVLVLLLCVCPASAYINFKDGLIHNIDYAINDNVRVDYLTPNKYTTVNVLTGASTSSSYKLQGYENSRINISGGSIDGALSCEDSSRVNISGGGIYGQSNSYDSSQVNISGGYTGNLSTHGSSQANISGFSSVGSLYSYDSSQVNVSGGWVYDFVSSGSSHVDISGGSIDSSLGSNESSQVNITGGSVALLQCGGSSKVDIFDVLIRGALLSVESGQVNIYDGSIEYIQSMHSSQVNIYGGTIGRGNLALFDQSVVQIFGYDFAVNGQPFGYGELTSIHGGDVSHEPRRYLTGTLLNGDLINNDFYIGNNAKIVLTIPEPASVILLGLGGLVISKKTLKNF